MGALRLAVLAALGAGCSLRLASEPCPGDTGRSPGKEDSTTSAGDDTGGRDTGGRDTGGRDTGASSGPPVRSVALGSAWSCALFEDAGVACLGEPEATLSGWSRDTVPADARALRGSSTALCTLLADGTAACWGWMGEGAVLEAADGAMIDLAVGDAHACAIGERATVSCWGEDAAGQATPPADLAGVTAIAVGASHTCALTEGGRPTCWGGDDPAVVDPPEGVALSALAAGGDAACGLDAHAGGLLRCWGAADSPVVALAPKVEAAAVAVSERFGCLVEAEGGAVDCWGEVGADPPTTPDGGWSEVYAPPTGDQACAVAAGAPDRLVCWGDGAEGETGELFWPAR